MEPVVARRLELVASLTDLLEVGDVYAVAAWTSFHIGRYADAVALADEGFRRAMPSALVMGLYCLDFRCGGALPARRTGTRSSTTCELFGELLAERSERPPGFASDHIAAAAFVHEVRGETADAERTLRVLDWLEDAEERPSQGMGGVASPGPVAPRASSPPPASCSPGRRRGSNGVWGTGWRRCATWSPSRRRGTMRRPRSARPGSTRRRPGCWPSLGTPTGWRARRRWPRETLNCGAELLERAADGFARLGARWEAARTAVRLASATAELGHRQRSEALARQALDVLTALRSLREADRAHQLASGD